MTVQCALLKCYTILGYSTETVLLIFPFLQTNITVQMYPLSQSTCIQVEDMAREWEKLSQVRAVFQPTSIWQSVVKVKQTINVNVTFTRDACSPDRKLYPLVSLVYMYPVIVVDGYKLLVRDTCIRPHVSGVKAAARQFYSCDH